MLCSHLGKARQCDAETLVRLTGEDVLLAHATRRKHWPREEDAPLTGVATEGAKVPYEGMRNAEMSGGVAGLYRPASIEHHRSQLVERRSRVACIALERENVRHRILVEIEPPRLDEPNERRHRQ